MDKFGLVHHRALNALATLQNIAKISLQYPNFTHIAEGDICWHFSKGRQDIYFRHPKYLIDNLSSKEIDEQKEKGKLFTLEDFLTNTPNNLNFIIELKTGKGDKLSAFKKLTGMLQETLKNRFWLDGFSVKQLSLIKKCDCTTPTSLHTKLIVGKRILETTPEIFPLNFHDVTKLEIVDIITLSYNTSVFAHHKSVTALEQGCVELFKAQKSLVLGGLKTPAMFNIAMQSSAKAGYAKFSLAEPF